MKRSMSGPAIAIAFSPDVTIASMQSPNQLTRAHRDSRLRNRSTGNRYPTSRFEEKDRLCDVGFATYQTQRCCRCDARRLVRIRPARDNKAGIRHFGYRSGFASLLLLL